MTKRVTARSDACGLGFERGLLDIAGDHVAVHVERDLIGLGIAEPQPAAGVAGDVRPSRVVVIEGGSAQLRGAGGGLARVVQQGRKLDRDQSGSSGCERVGQECLDLVGVIPEHRLEVGHQPLEPVDREQAVLQDVEVVVLVLLDAPHLREFGECRAEQPDLVHPAEHSRRACIAEDEREFSHDSLRGDAPERARPLRDCLERLGHHNEAERRREAEYPQKPKRVLVERVGGCDPDQLVLEVVQSTAGIDDRTRLNISVTSHQWHGHRVDGEIALPEVVLDRTRRPSR